MNKDVLLNAFDMQYFYQKSEIVNKPIFIRRQLSVYFPFDCLNFKKYKKYKMRVVFLALGILISISGSAQDYAIKNGELVIVKPVEFKAGTAELLPASDEALLIIKKYLDDKSYITLLRVESHVSEVQGDRAQSLTQQRSTVICRRLVQLGVDCKRLIAVGFGSTKPLADNSTPEGKSMNNRSSFINATLRDRPIGGLPTDGGGVVAGNPCL